MPPVLPPLGPLSRRRNRSARPQAISPERGDPFRQRVEITSVHGWTPRGRMTCLERSWQPCPISGVTPHPRKRGERFSPSSRRPAFGVPQLQQSHRRQGPQDRQLTDLASRPPPFAGLAQAGSGRNRVIPSNAIASAITGSSRCVADQGRAPALPRHVARKASGSAWPWRRRGSSRPVRRRSAAS